MNKAQAIHNFWNSFGVRAYNEFTVPEDVTFPYITYNFATAAIDEPVSMYASIWDRGTSWETVELMSEQIAQRLFEILPIKLDNGYVHLKAGTPYSQRMNDEDDMIRRLYINVVAEYLTAY